MPIKFSDLPNELLRKVLTRNALSNSDLCSIARASKHFSELAIPVLYRHVKIRRLEDDHSSLGLIKTITHNPSRADLIEYISIAWAENDKTMDRDQEPIVQFLLRRTPRLQVLKLKVFHLEEYPMPFCVFDDSFLSVNPMTELTRVEIEYFNTTWDTIGKLMLLPKLDCMFVKPMDRDARRIERRLPVRPTGAVSNIRYLGLEGHPRSTSHVYELVCWTKKLRCLLFDFGDHAPIQMGPSTLQEFLTPISQTIQYLIFQGCHSLKFHQAKVDFSNFASLKTLHISQALLFPTYFDPDGVFSKEPFTRNSLYLRLPKSLEELTIFFDCGTAVLDRHFHPKHHKKIDEDYDWIEELATYKPDFLPALKLVHLSEHSHANRSKHNESTLHPWNTPKGITKLFHERDIELKVLVRWYWLEAHGNLSLTEANLVTPSPKRLLDMEELALKIGL